MTSDWVRGDTGAPGSISQECVYTKSENQWTLHVCQPAMHVKKTKPRNFVRWSSIMELFDEKRCQARLNCENQKPDGLAEANPILIRITTDVEVAVACNCINEFILITCR